MPKLIELTVELDVQKVSCPGVWLCQDGRVSLTVFALGTSYQTCLLPPIFPLVFKDVFYFRKRFAESCALNNICCLLQDETIYCELVQWCDDCLSSECTILAQYLGALNDVLFPSNMCSNEGVDLLMRRSKDFPGILSPKIEIATKVRIDELLNQPCSNIPKSIKIKACSCKRPEPDPGRQKQVCHTPMFHRIRCSKRSPTVSRSRSRSGGSRSCCSLRNKEAPEIDTCNCPNPLTKSRVTLWGSSRGARCREYAAYHVETPGVDTVWRGVASNLRSTTDNSLTSSEVDRNKLNQSDERLYRLILESQYIDQDHAGKEPERPRRRNKVEITPCVCEICKRYHELFHRGANCTSKR